MRGRTRNMSRRIGSLSGVSWTPTRLTGLIGWWYAAASQCLSDAGGTTPCSNGDGIYVWNNARGGTDISQATAGARATYSTTGPSATFDGGDYYDTFATGSPAGLFSFHRFKTSATGYHSLYDDLASNVMLWVDLAGRLEPDAGAGNWNAGPIVSDGAWHTVFVFRSNAVGTRMWVDFSEVTPTLTGVRTVPATIDLFSRGGAVPFYGSIRKFGFATALPSTTELAKLQTYLTS